MSRRGALANSKQAIGPAVCPWYSQHCKETSLVILRLIYERGGCDNSGCRPLGHNNPLESKSFNISAIKHRKNHVDVIELTFSITGLLSAGSIVPSRVGNPCTHAPESSLSSNPESAHTPSKIGLYSSSGIGSAQICLLYVLE